MSMFGSFFDFNGDGKSDAIEDAIGVATFLTVIEDDGEERFDADDLRDDDEDEFDEDDSDEEDF